MRALLSAVLIVATTLITGCAPSADPSEAEVKNAFEIAARESGWQVENVDVRRGMFFAIFTKSGRRFYTWGQPSRLEKPFLATVGPAGFFETVDLADAQAIVERDGAQVELAPNGINPYQLVGGLTEEWQNNVRVFPSPQHPGAQLFLLYGKAWVIIDRGVGGTVKYPVAVVELP